MSVNQRGHAPHTSLPRQANALLRFQFDMRQNDLCQHMPKVSVRHETKRKIGCKCNEVEPTIIILKRYPRHICPLQDISMKKEDRIPLEEGASPPLPVCLFSPQKTMGTAESNQIKIISIALRTSADISKCCTETQPKTPNSKQCCLGFQKMGFQKNGNPFGTHFS